MSPIDRARAMVEDRQRRWEAAHPGQRWPHKPFRDELWDYVTSPNGFVMANGLFFIAAKSITLTSEWPMGNRFTGPAWLISFAVGPLPALIGALVGPPKMRLPYLVFSRHEQDRLRVYRTDRILRTAPKATRILTLKTTPNLRPPGVI